MTATKNAGAVVALLVLLACGAACRESPRSGTPSPAQPQRAAQPVAPEPARKGEPHPQAGDAGNPVEACVDAWLAQRKLDPYGNAEGTMYAGGTPLFNEQTGETTDRLAYVFAKHPDAKAACQPAAGGDAGAGAKPGGLPTR